MEKTYTIRIDQIDNIIDKLTEFIQNDLVLKALISLEIADKTKKPHYQGFFIVDSNIIDYQGVKNLFRSHFSKLKAHQKSCVVMNKETYKSYILKQKQVVINKNFTQEEIDSIPEWIEKKTSKTYREEFYSKFLDSLRSSNDYNDKERVIDTKWIASMLVDFMGYQPRAEQISYLKGVVFSAQCVLLHERGHEAKESQLHYKLRLIDAISL